MMNYLKLSILFVSLIGTQAFTEPNLAQPKFDSTLANYLVNLNTLDYAVDPSLSENCFSLYLPILSAVADAFSTQYQTCITVANNKIANLTAEADKHRKSLMNETNGICVAYQNCLNESDILSFFNCYSHVPSTKLSVVYTLSNTAITPGNNFTDGLKTIQNKQNLCRDHSENTYVINSAIANQELEECLQNDLLTSSADVFVPTESTATILKSAHKEDSK